MDNNNNHSFGDLQSSAYLLSSATTISRLSEHTSDMLQKVAPVKADLFTFGNGIGSENFAMSWCVGGGFL